MLVWIRYSDQWLLTPDQVSGSIGARHFVDDFSGNCKMSQNGLAQVV
jgi:hypothetical protein